MILKILFTFKRGKHIVVHPVFKKYYSSLLPFTETELMDMIGYVETVELKRGQMILKAGQVCDFAMFINEGIMRHFFYDDKGNDITCDISMENDFYTDTKSLETGMPATISSQALTGVSVSIIKRSALDALLRNNNKFAEAHRIIMSRVNQRLTNHLLMLSEDRPEKRYRMLLDENPEFIKRVPLRYIAGYLRITPESLSRIRKRITLKS